MGSRSMTTVVTADTMALNAAVFGYAGHSVLTPHQAIQNIWWTDERIEAKVTRDFVLSKLRPSVKEQLFQPMFDDSGLTEDTYLDWVLGRAKRIFLVLVECGCSDRIFGIAENSWDDDDLPIPLGEIPRLALSASPRHDDPTLNRRFYDNQFRFLLRPLEFHGHIDYATNEVVPIEYVHKIAPAAALQKWSRFHLPKMPTLVYARRKVSLGDKDEINPELKERFLEDVQMARSIEHEHIAPVFATWSQKGHGYIMSSFVAEHTLRSFIDFRSPASMQKVSRQDRYAILLEWIHCLAHAVAHLHRKRLTHSAIYPSNIVVDENNKIAFADLGFLETFQKDKKLEADEFYNYGAPELFDETGKVNPVALIPPGPTKSFFKMRRKSSMTSYSGSDTSSETASALSVDSRGRYVFKERSNSEATITPITTASSDGPPPPPKSPEALASPTLNTISDKRSSTSSKATTAASTSVPVDQSARSSAITFTSDRSAPDRQLSDIYSLGCVFLDILTCLLKRKPNDFPKHRATKHRNVTGKGTHTDASFHANPDKVTTWIEILENGLPALQDRALFAVPPLLRLIAEMLDEDPARRPRAAEVRDRAREALLSHGGLRDLHCFAAHEEHLLRPESKLSWGARTSSSGGSTSLRPATAGSSLSSPTAAEPRLASFPPIASLIAPPVPPKSPHRQRRPTTSSSESSRPGTAQRVGSPPLTPPVPPVPATFARMSGRLFGSRHRRVGSGETGLSGTSA